MDWIDAPWFWAGLGLALLAAETLVPGALLLWLGFAAVAMVPIVLVFPGMGLVGQSIVFAILAMASVGIGWKLRRQHTQPSTSPLLNRRASQLIGRTLPLTRAVVNGRGQVQIDDAYWIVEGPDLPEGTNVRVVAADTMLLRVVPVD